ncbi:MAG: glycosyltransferase [Pseudomonadota bacterium]
MRIVFAHQNFPAQFGAFGGWLAQQGWDVAFLSAAETINPPERTVAVRARPSREPAQETHRLARSMERAAINGHAMASAAMKLVENGFRPDVIMAHSGWGSGTFLKAVWPDAAFVPYLEWYYNAPATDRLPGETAEVTPDQRAVAISRNMPIIADLAQAAGALCPTLFQRDQLPAALRDGIAISHDGVDCTVNAPDREAQLEVGGAPLPPEAEIVTYATRGMEPHRGFPEFMRALARLQQSRPRLHAVIGGEDRVCYGAALPEGESWKARLLSELDLDLDRVHFVGLQPRPAYRRMLQASHAHIYLTVPFVLSWSLLEAMAVGAPIVASDVAPVREAMRDGIHGRLIDHTDIDALTGAMAATLDAPDAGRQMGLRARQQVLERYDRARLWPERAAWLTDLSRPDSATASF